MGSRMTREQPDSCQQSKKRFDAPFCALSVRRSPFFRINKVGETSIRWKTVVPSPRF